MAANKEKCPSCGQFIKAGSPFCIRCGAQIKKITIEEDVKTESEPVQTEQPDPAENRRLKPATYIEHPAMPAQESKPVSEDVSSHHSEPENTYNPRPAHAAIPTMQDDPDDSDMEASDEDDSEMMIEEELEEDYEDAQDPEDKPEEEYEPEEASQETVEDDDETFYAYLAEKRNSSDQKKKPEKAKQTSLENKRKVLNKNILAKEEKETEKTQPVKRRKVQTAENPKPKAAERTPAKATPKYDPNSDHYYDNVMAEVDARISHFSKENIVLTTAFVILCIVILVAMIYCVVL